MKSIRMVAIISMLLIVHSLSSEQSFTKKRSENIASMRERCCEELDEILAIIPETLRSCADVQEGVAQILREFVQGQKEACLSCASKEQLQQLRLLLKEIRASYESHLATIREKIKEIANVHREVCKVP